MFDVIIVGGGSAGSLLANRLSADPKRRVCLIEAGPRDKSPFIHIPLGIAILARSGEVDWGYHTAPQSQLNNRRLYWPRGKTLGGSSSVNAMIYIRGHHADYTAWEAAAGSAWSPARAFELFRALEDNADIGADIADEHHGRGGPLSVSNLRTVNPLSRAFVEAGVQCQYPENPDFNGANQEGVGIYQVTQKNGRRWSAARAYLDPVRSRKNLEIATGALVERVLFEGRRATGVRLGGRTIHLKPGGEVILAAGAINSPQLLMLSGVGPGAELSRAGIAVLHHNPEVGANLADHLDVSVIAKSRGREPIGLAWSALPRFLRAGLDFATKGTGELTSNVAEAGGFVKSSPDRERPNLQFHFLPAILRDHGRQLTFGYGITLHICDLQPKSRGHIGLDSPDPAAPARIDANYLNHPDDLPVLLEGLKIARRVIAAPALAKHIREELHPGPAAQSDEALIADIRARAETIYHPVGTCRMGRDAGSVVDPEGRVRGLDGLRVIDASIMPSLPAGNTNAPTMMLAENIARMMTL